MYGGLAAVALVLILLMRPWQLADPASRELSALAAAVMLGMLFLRSVLVRLDSSSRTGRRFRRPAAGSLPAFDTDDAFIALLIASMDASGHVSAEEASRAHHIIWSMRRFRGHSGETVGRKIERVRALIERHESSRIIAATATKIPSRLRGAAFAVATDLVLVDGRLERAERRFLEGFAAHLRLTPVTARRILDVIRIKNSA